MVEHSKIVDIIRGHIDHADNGTLFFNNSFPDYDDEYVGKVLSDLVKQQIICRLSRGIYLKATKTKFGLVYPTTEEIAKAIAERDNFFHFQLFGSCSRLYATIREHFRKFLLINAKSCA